MAALQHFLDARHESITALDLDFVDWREVQNLNDLSDDSDDAVDESTVLGDLILPLPSNNYEEFLPNLQAISLSAASLQGSYECLINAFSFWNVEELRLLNCKYAMQLLDHMVKTALRAEVTKLELVLIYADMELTTEELFLFLAPFACLEDLFVLFEPPFADSCYVEPILKSRETLQRLVYHRRDYCLANKSPYFEEFCDSNLDETESGFPKLLRETRLESAGICAEPVTLRKVLRDAAPTMRSLKLLRLRFTGKVAPKPRYLKNADDFYEDRPYSEFLRAANEAGTAPPPRYPGPDDWVEIAGYDLRDVERRELEDFADWTFGPNGFPCLQVLTSGDFSHGDRFADTRTLWCRNYTSPQVELYRRPIERDDIAEHELVDSNMDMLSACPVSPLFYKYG